MAVPSSGQLSLNSIYNEIDDDDYAGGTTNSNVSLTGLSIGSVDTINTANDAADRPNGTSPHKMSEFYSYDHDASSVWTWTWDNNKTHHEYPHISGSRSYQNTAPNSKPK